MCCEHHKVENHWPTHSDKHGAVNLGLLCLVEGENTEIIFVVKESSRSVIAYSIPYEVKQALGSFREITYEAKIRGL